MVFTRDDYLSDDQIRNIDRIEMVREIFPAITEKYDFLNHFLSLRRDIAWRRFAVKQIRFFKTCRFLDVATGTSDLAIEAATRFPHIHVAGLDFVAEMLNQGMKKIGKKHLSQRIDLIKGDALQIPFAPDTFDAVGIAFGIRNIPDKVNTLTELRRVVVPGGQVLVLELTLPQGGYFRQCYDLYLNRFLPLVAGVFSPYPKAYHYLGNSIMDFPSVDSFARIMQDAGWAEVQAHALTMGICHLFMGVKPNPDNPVSGSPTARGKQKKPHPKPKGF